MERKYYITVDGGGSKTIALLYDDELNLISSARSDGVNVLFKPKETAKQNLGRMMDDLFAGRDIEVEYADGCLVCGLNDVTDIVFRHPRVKHPGRRPETLIAFAAAFKMSGINVIAGTGSGVCFVENGEKVTGVGGCGPLFGDEGSGYDIGLRAIKAALKQNDGRGRKTMLHDLALKKWSPGGQMWDIVVLFANNPETRQEISSFAKEVTVAANAGDEVAISIYKDAAYELFLQFCAVADRVGDRWDGYVNIMGGAWKGYHGFLDEFKRLVTERYPQAYIQKPIFEPVIGGMVLRQLELGRSFEELKPLLIERFPEYLYKG